MTDRELDACVQGHMEKQGGVNGAFPEAAPSPDTENDPVNAYPTPHQQAMKARRLELIRRAATGQPPAPTGSTFVQRPTRRKRGQAPFVPPRWSGEHRALPNAMFTTLRSGNR